MANKPAYQDNKPFVLLVHGLYMHGVYMHPLAKKLAQAGFVSHAPSYHSLTKSIDAHSQVLHDWLSRHHTPQAPINLVGHSLGGLVIRHFLANFGQAWQIGRCVTLGTPHQGSICADYVHKLLPPLVRHAYPNALDGQCLLPPNSAELGVIAGSRSLGLGLPIVTYYNKRQSLMASDRSNDGTVYVSETYLPQAKDHIVLPVSHTELLTDKTVAQQVIYFLEHGQFLRQ